MAVVELPSKPPARRGGSAGFARPRQAWRPQVDRLLLVVSLATGAVTHGFNLFNYPLYVTDEGIYIQQAWSVLREARLSPYTYFYDHAPAGWLVIAAWVALRLSQFRALGNARDPGRALMRVVHVANTFFLYRVTARLSGSTVGAVIAAF